MRFLLSFSLLALAVQINAWSSTPTCQEQTATETLTVTQTQEQQQTVTVTKTQEQQQTVTATVTQEQQTTITTTQEETQTQTVTQEQTQTITQTEEQTQTVTEAPSTVTKTVTQEEEQTVTETQTREQTQTETLEETQTVTQTENLTQTITEAPSTVTITTTQEEVQTTTAVITQQEVQRVTRYQTEEITVTVNEEELQTVTAQSVQTVYISTCPPSTTTRTSSSTTSTQSSSCPTNLNGEYQFPHLIIPVNSSSPNTAYGSSYFGEVTPEISSIFNFDIPASYSGLQCSLIFLFLTQSQLSTSSYTLTGPGTVDVALLSAVATSQTTFANMPTVKTDYGNFTFQPNNSYRIATFPCPANTAISFELGSVNGTSLTYFQDYNPSPIGLYITACPNGTVNKRWSPRGYLIGS